MLIMKTFRKILSITFVHLAVYLFLTGLWIGSFHTPLLGGMDIFFYRGLGLILIFGLTAAIVVMLLMKINALSLTGRDVVLQFFLFCCVNTVLFTHLPVTAERSVSVFMLGYLADHPEESFSQEEIEDVFIRRYVRDYGAFEKRLHEQEITGTIRMEENGSVRITPEGIALMRIYDKAAGWFGISDKLIHP